MIKKLISASIAVKQQILADDGLIATLQQIINTTVKAYRADKRVYFCGNGGSAADAQHLAAEFSGRFYKDRKPLYAEALHVNTSYITAVANDYSYADIYSRMISEQNTFFYHCFSIFHFYLFYFLFFIFEEVKK